MCSLVVAGPSIVLDCSAPTFPPARQNFLKCLSRTSLVIARTSRGGAMLVGARARASFISELAIYRSAPFRCAADLDLIVSGPAINREFMRKPTRRASQKAIARAQYMRACARGKRDSDAKIDIHHLSGAECLRDRNRCVAFDRRAIHR